MANTQYNSQIDTLQRQIGEYQGRMQSSPTAMLGESEATEADIENQAELLRLQNSIDLLKRKKLTEQWYPERDPAGAAREQEGTQAGLVGTAVDVLSRPLYGIVGAANGI